MGNVPTKLPQHGYATPIAGFQGLSAVVGWPLLCQR